MTPARLLVEVDAESADATSGRLWMLGTIGVEEQAGSSSSDHVLLLAGFDSIEDAEAAQGEVGGRVEPVTDDRWLDAWREHARVHRAGDRFVIKPTWLGHDAAPGEVILHFDPGRAFGTGAHPSTRLVLAELERLLEGDERVLDVGCGSGLLAIGAARIGATDVVAVDTDPEAVRVTSDNAALNGVGGLISVSPTPVADLGSGGFDVVVANILAVTLVELAPELIRLTGERGRIVLSGMIDRQVDEVTDAYAPMSVVASSSEEGWVCLVLAP